MRGKRKTTAEHKRDGTYRQDHHGNRADTKIQTGNMPEPPRELKPFAAEMWRDICEQIPSDVLARIDVYQLMGMCEFWQEYREVIDEMKRCEGLRDPPYYRLMQMKIMAWKHFEAASRHFGMTPQDRAKIKIVETEKDDGDPLTQLKLRRAT